MPMCIEVVLFVFTYEFWYVLMALSNINGIRSEIYLFNSLRKILNQPEQDRDYSIFCDILPLNQCIDNKDDLNDIMATIIPVMAVFASPFDLLLIYIVWINIRCILSGFQKKLLLQHCLWQVSNMLARTLIQYTSFFAIYSQGNLDGD